MKDPVCGMDVKPESALYHYEHDGEQYYFCSEHCLVKFRENPDKYLATEKDTGTMAEPGELEGEYFCPMCPGVHADKPGPCPKCGMALEPAGGGSPGQRVEWTCPMHPDVVQDQPGNCPKCGMALEARTVAGEEEENPELDDMRRRFWVAVALTVPVFVIAMGHMVPGRPLERFLSGSTMGWIELLFATPVVFWAGWPFFQRFWTSIVNRSLNMFTLIGLGVGVAYF